jgi:hypothetical protein
VSERLGELVETLHLTIYRLRLWGVRGSDMGTQGKSDLGAYTVEREH